MIYLDNAATTLRKPPCVIDAVVSAMQTMGNSGRSAHAESLTASRTIYAAREALAALFGCERADHVCFTANSTEALNIAISGLLAPGDHVLSTDLEHNSVLRPLYREKERGVSVCFLPANRQGCIDYAGFDRLLQKNTRAVICTAGSNLTGNLLDLARIGAFCAAHGLLKAAAARHLHACDANASHVVLSDNLRKLLGIVDAIELRAANKAHATLQEVFVEGAIGERRAIGSHKQIAALEIRGIHRRELYLYRPVRQARRHVHHR